MTPLFHPETMLSEYQQIFKYYAQRHSIVEICSDKIKCLFWICGKITKSIGYFGISGSSQQTYQGFRSAAI